MAVNEGSSSLLSALAPAKGHKATLTTLLARDDLDAATSATPVELPTAPPLSHESFAGEEFDASDFLLERRHTGLDELRSELRAYLATLRTSLVAVINTEYEAFIGLSLGLRHASVSSSLQTIRRPVLSIRTEVGRVKDELDQMRTEMDSVLSERKQVREKKLALRRLLEMEDQLDKVEGLLQLKEAAKDRDNDSTGDSPAKRIERVAAEYNHVLYLVNKAGDLPFVRSLDPRVARITSTLKLDLAQLLTNTLTADTLDRPELTTLLRTYATLELIPQAEGIIRTAVVRPFAERAIHRDTLTAPLSPPAEPAPTGLLAVPGSAEPRSSFYKVEPITSAEVGGTETEALVGLYNKLLGFVANDLGVVLDVAERTLAVPATTIVGAGVKAEGKRKGYEVLANVVFDELVNRLISEMGHVIFAAGRPGVFHQNYVLANAFLTRIEGLCPTLAHLTALRNHPTYSAFIKRFQLPVYFQLRLKEVVTSVERAFSAGSASGGGEAFVMSESEAVWRAIQACWARDVHLNELTARFWRLTLQLVSRYRTWLNATVPKYVLPSNGSSANLSAVAAGGGSSRTSFEGGRDRLGAPTRPGTPAGGEEQSEEATLRQLTVLIADSCLMEKKVEDLFERRIRGMLPEEEAEPSDSNPRAVLQESLSLLTSVVPSLSSQVVTILVKHCAEHLKSVRAAISQVRASTRKTAGAEPSFFVPLIFKELAAYLNGPGRVVEQSLRSRWAESVVEDVANKYTSYLNEQKKTQASLSWLKKGRQGGLSFFGRGAAAAAEDGPTDDDRVRTQIQLDVETLAQDAERLGVDVSAMPAFEALRAATLDAAEEKK